MEAGFKIESFACFVSETSRNIYGKEQRLPKGLQELLVSWWGCTQHIPQLLASAWAEPEFQRAPHVPRAASSWSSSFPVWELHAWGGNKKHSQVFHSDGLSSILTPKAVWTKTGLLPGEHLEGLEMESTSSTWTWGATKAAFLKHKSTFHIGEWTVTGIGEFMARWRRQTVQVLFSRAAHEL